MNKNDEIKVRVIDELKSKLEYLRPKLSNEDWNYFILFTRVDAILKVAIDFNSKLDAYNKLGDRNITDIITTFDSKNND